MVLGDLAQINRRVKSLEEDRNVFDFSGPAILNNEVNRIILDRDCAILVGLIYSQINMRLKVLTISSVSQPDAEERNQATSN